MMNAQPTPQFPNELVGVCKTIGRLGPPYQVIGPTPNDDGLSLARIVLLESGLETDYPVQDLLSDPFAPQFSGKRSLFAIAFDLEITSLRDHYPGHIPAAYKDVERTLAARGFSRIQGSVYVNQTESLVDVTNAMNDLRTLPWFRHAVADIRVFRIEQWSDFTGFQQAP